MDIEKTAKHIEQLNQLKQRYLAWHESAAEDGRIAHYLTCDIYRSKECYGFAVCTCGLLFDLHRLMDIVDPEKLYPPFSVESGNQDRDWKAQQEWDNMSDEDKEQQRRECTEILKNAFNFDPDAPPTPKEIAAKDQQDTYEWKLIDYVFGPTFRVNTEKFYESGKPSNFWDGTKQIWPNPED